MATHRQVTWLFFVKAQFPFLRAHPVFRTIYGKTRVWSPNSKEINVRERLCMFIFAVKVGYWQFYRKQIVFIPAGIVLWSPNLDYCGRKSHLTKDTRDGWMDR